MCVRKIWAVILPSIRSGEACFLDPQGYICAGLRLPVSDL